MAVPMTNYNSHFSVVLATVGTVVVALILWVLFKYIAPSGRWLFESVPLLLETLSKDDVGSSENAI